MQDALIHCGNLVTTGFPLVSWDLEENFIPESMKYQTMYCIRKKYHFCVLFCLVIFPQYIDRVWNRCSYDITFAENSTKSHNLLYLLITRSQTTSLFSLQYQRSLKQLFRIFELSILKL